jgi:hypothetical protein
MERDPKRVYEKDIADINTIPTADNPPFPREETDTNILLIMKEPGNNSQSWWKWCKKRVDLYRELGLNRYYLIASPRSGKKK